MKDVIVIVHRLNIAENDVRIERTIENDFTVVFTLEREFTSATRRFSHAPLATLVAIDQRFNSSEHCLLRPKSLVALCEFFSSSILPIKSERLTSSLIHETLIVQGFLAYQPSRDERIIIVLFDKFVNLIHRRRHITIIMRIVVILAVKQIPRLVICVCAYV